MKKVIIIAEAGVNHNGDIHLAKKLIDAAADANADYVKFQTWVTDNVMTVGAPKAEYQKIHDNSQDQYEMAKRLELSFSQFKELYEYCQEKNIYFLSTPEEKEGLDFLVDKLQLPLIKIGSGELDNIVFLRQVGQKKTSVILSTGMGTLAETKRAYDVLKNAGAKKVSILHCTSNYPAEFTNINLKAINALQSEFDTDIGYSDHSIGIEVAVAAVALGASIIEKHFTFDKNLPGPDHAASLDPIELKDMVQKIRNVEMAMNGSGKKEPQESELEVKKVVRKGPYLARALKVGEVLHESDLHFKRPVQSIRADQADLFIGRAVVTDLPAGHCLSFNDFLLNEEDVDNANFK